MANFNLDKKNRPELLDMVLPEPGEYWGGLNRYDQYSRWTIGESDFDYLVNWIPMGQSLRQTPGNAPVLATLAAQLVWMEMLPLNGVVYIFCLCANGHLYQVTTDTGTITDCSGATSLNPASDIACWQGTQILVSDPVASTLYNWNGTTFATALTGISWAFIEVFQQRVWGAKNSVLSWTNLGTYNSLGGDAGSLTITDSTVLEPINALKSFQGSLYIFGADYIQTVTGLADTGSPAVLIFTLTTLQSTIGTNSKWSIIAVGSALYFANNYGLWVLNGAIPEMISGEINGLLNQVGSPDPNVATLWSAGYMQIYSQPCIVWHFKDISNTQGIVCRTVVGESEQQQLETLGGGAYWFLVQNTPAPVFITSYVMKGNPTLIGCDGTQLFSMVTNVGASVTSTLNTRIWDFDYFLQEDIYLYFGFSMLCLADTTCTVQVIDQSNVVRKSPPSVQRTPANFLWTNSNQTFIWHNAGNVFNWSNLGNPLWIPFQWSIDMIGRGIGFNVTTVGIGNVFQRIGLQIKKTPASWGSNQGLAA